MRLQNSTSTTPDLEIETLVHESPVLARLASKAFLKGADEHACYAAVLEYVRQRTESANDMWQVIENGQLTALSSEGFTLEKGRLTLFRLRADGLLTGYMEKPGMTRFVVALDSQTNLLVLLLCYRKKNSRSLVPPEALQSAIDSYLELSLNKESEEVLVEHKDAFLLSIMQVLQGSSTADIETFHTTLTQQSLSEINDKVAFGETYTDQDISDMLAENDRMQAANQKLHRQILALREGLAAIHIIEPEEPQARSTLKNKKAEKQNDTSRDKPVSVFTQYKNRFLGYIKRFNRD